MDRLSMTAGFYRRQFYNLDVTDNTNLAVTDWSPFNITAPTDPRLPDSGSVITMHTLNANKVDVATDNLRTFSDINTSVYNGFEVSANCAVHQAVAVRRHHHRPPGDDLVRRTRQPEQRALLRLHAALPHHVQDVGRLSTAV